MGFFHEYPYTDFHEINLDWILKQIMTLHKDYDEFKAVNTITNAGAWDITKQYQAWTIVSDNNKGYISLKPVPAGIDISNTEYWGLVADYDILITDLSNRIDQAEQHIEDLTKVVSSPLQGRRFVFLTDSYGEVSDNFLQFIRTTDSYFVEGDTMFSFAYGGGGFYADNGRTYDWEPRFIDSGDVDTVTNPNTITDVYITGGNNDMHSAYTDIRTAAISLCTKIRQKFPNATMYLGAVAYTKATTGVRGGAAIPFLVQSYSAIANQIPHCHFIDHSYAWLHYTGFVSDNVHPTASGSRLIAAGMLRTIYKLPAIDVSNNTIQPVDITGIAGSLLASPKLYTGSSGGENWIMNIGSVGFSDGSVFKFNASWNELLSLDSATFLYGALDARYFANTHMKFKYNGTGYSVPVAIKLYNYKLYYRAGFIDNLIPGAASGVALDQTEFFAFELRKPAEYF